MDEPPWTVYTDWTTVISVNLESKYGTEQLIKVTGPVFEKKKQTNLADVWDNLHVVEGKM